MIKGRETDLLVCFPSRAQLTLMPKPICSPSRPAEPGKRHRRRAAAGRGQASPLFKAKNKHSEDDVAEEPTSPKVTCAGQVKVRPRPGSSKPGGCDSWLSAVEEIERLQGGRRRRGRRPKSNWIEALGIKKDVMHFMNALRGLRFDMRCFGSFGAAADCTTDDDDDEEEEEEEEEKVVDSSAPSAIFSKWFMVLEENQSHACKRDVEEEEQQQEEQEQEQQGGVSAPPSNALLLMRCRSAPAKGWREDREEEGEKVGFNGGEKEEKEEERMVLMSYAPDFFKVSTEIAKETWVVGSMDPLGRSRSWRR